MLPAQYREPERDFNWWVSKFANETIPIVEDKFARSTYIFVHIRYLETFGSCLSLLPNYFPCPDERHWFAQISILRIDKVRMDVALFWKEFTCSIWTVRCFGACRLCKAVQNLKICLHSLWSAVLFIAILNGKKKT
jgi:hypothetical protein